MTADEHFNNGVVAYMGDSFVEANDSFTKAIEMWGKDNPEASEAYSKRGCVRYYLKQHDEAIADCTKAIELTLDNVSAYRDRGHVYNQLEKYDEAIADYSKAIELEPTGGISYRNRGYAYNKLKRHAEALVDYDKAIEISPNNDVSYSNRASAYNALKRYDEAIADCTKALELNSRSIHAYNNRSAAYIERGQHEEVIDDCAKVIEIEPNNIAAYNNRGHSYNKIDLYEKALADFTKAIELIGEDNFEAAEFYNNLGYSCNKLKRYNEALTNYSKAIEMCEAHNNSHNSSYAYANRGHTYNQLKEYDNAIKDCTKAIELNPKNDSAYNNRAYSYGELRRYDEAISDTDKAIDLNPDMTILHANRAVVLTKKDADARLAEITKNYEKTIGAYEDRFESLINMEDRSKEFEQKHNLKNKWLIAIVIILFVIYGAGVLFIVDAISNEDPSTNKSIFTALPYVLMLILVSSPLIYWARLLRADADKAEILREDFFRRRYVENIRVSIAESNSVLSNEILQTYAFHWLESSPAETLARINSKAEQPKMHLLEDLVSRLRKTGIKTDTPS